MKNALEGPQWECRAGGEVSKEQKVKGVSGALAVPGNKQSCVQLAFPG